MSIKIKKYIIGVNIGLVVLLSIISVSLIYGGFSSAAYADAMLLWGLIFLCVDIIIIIITIILIKKRK